MFDVSPLTPASRPIVLRAAEVYYKHTQPWFIGLLIHGSAFKGGMIPGCSDIDFQLYLEEAAFDRENELQISLALAIHRDLSRIDVSPFQYIQTYTFASRPLGGNYEGWIGPVPGGYHILLGKLPIPEATPQQVLHRARSTLEQLLTGSSPSSEAARSLLSHGEGKLSRAVRLLCTRVWPMLYSMLTFKMEDPLAVWRLPKDAAIALLPEDDSVGKEIRAFHRRVYSYYTGNQSVEEALTIIEQGVRFLRTVEQWYMARKGTVK